MRFDLPPHHNDYDEMVLAVCESTEEQFGSSFWPKLLHWNVDWPWCRSSSWWAMMMMILLAFSLWCLAALAAQGLPWILTVLSYWLLWIQSLPAFQTKRKPCKTDGGNEKTWTDQQKDNDKDKYKDKYYVNVNDIKFREHIQRAIFETFDHLDMCLEWWEKMTWSTRKTTTKTKTRQ